MNLVDCLPLYEDAAFYDLEFADRDFDLAFYRSLAGEASGPVLEVGCGTGRLTIPIAAAGHDITGLDVSRPMLDRAREQSTTAGLAIRWVEQDCRGMRFDRTFGLIFAAASAVQHLTDVRSVSEFLQSARRCLQPAGRLVIDVCHPALAKLLRPAEQRYLHKTISVEDGSPIRVEAASHYKPSQQILQFDLFYLQDGRLIRTKQVRMRMYFPQELLALCELNGLIVEQQYGDYERSRFCDSSPRQILICRRSPE